MTVAIISAFTGFIIITATLDNKIDNTPSKNIAANLTDTHGNGLYHSDNVKNYSNDNNDTNYLYLINYKGFSIQNVNN